MLELKIAKGKARSQHRHLCHPQASEPFTQASEPSAQVSEPSPQASEPFPQASEPFTQASEPSAQVSEPFTQASELSAQASELSTQASEPFTQAPEHGLASPNVQPSAPTQDTRTTISVPLQDKDCGNIRYNPVTEVVSLHKSSSQRVGGRSLTVSEIARTRRMRIRQTLVIQRRRNGVMDIEWDVREYTYTI